MVVPDVSLQRIHMKHARILRRCVVRIHPRHVRVDHEHHVCLADPLALPHSVRESDMARVRRGKVDAGRRAREHRDRSASRTSTGTASGLRPRYEVMIRGRCAPARASATRRAAVPNSHGKGIPTYGKGLYHSSITPPVQEARIAWNQRLAHSKCCSMTSRLAQRYTGPRGSVFALSTEMTLKTWTREKEEDLRRRCLKGFTVAGATPITSATFFPLGFALFCVCTVNSRGDE
jgi:hypothetical protein